MIRCWQVATSALVAAVVACAPVQAQDKALIDKGAKLYVAQKCTLCHSIDGKGNAKGALDGVGSKLKADEIREWLVHPVEMTAKTKAARKPVMKAYASLSKEDLDALVAYVESLKKK